MELYINYDCDLTEKFIVSNLISAFSDIIKGRFIKKSNKFTEKENNELINYGLKIFSIILQNILDLSKKIYIKKKDNNTNDNKGLL